MAKSAGNEARSNKSGSESTLNGEGQLSVGVETLLHLRTRSENA